MSRYEEAYAIEIRSFVEFCRTGTAPSPNGYDGLQSLLLANAAQKSATEHVVVQLQVTRLEPNVRNKPSVFPAALASDSHCITGVWLGIDKFKEVFKLLAKSGAPFSTGLVILGLEIPQILAITIPISILLATFLTFQKEDAEQAMNFYIGLFDNSENRQVDQDQLTLR